MPEIKLEHITKRWKNFYAVDDLNLVINDNAFVTLLGPSGCGKTTTLRMIAGLETPTSGRITIGDRVVYDSALGINIPANKRKVGFLFQNYALWPNMTVYENIAFGLSNIKESMPKVDFEARNNARMAEILQNPADVKRVIEECRDKKGKLDDKKAIIKLIDEYTISQYTAKKLFAYHVEERKDVSGEAEALAKKAADAVAAQGLNEKFEFVKDGKVVEEVRKLTKEEIDLSVRRVSRIVKISMFMDRYPAELSGGQQQRVAIARTLAPEPTVLFMDEPLSNLDAKLRLEMRYELQRLHVETGSTFVYVTHDQMEAMTLVRQTQQPVCGGLRRQPLHQLRGGKGPPGGGRQRGADYAGRSERLLQERGGTERRQVVCRARRGRGRGGGGPEGSRQAEGLCGKGQQGRDLQVPHLQGERRGRRPAGGARADQRGLCAGHPA